jgi:peptidoglycan hydrolase-like protein with peptidoglycan-binding domain
LEPIHIGSVGPAVEDIQKRLNMLGFDLGPRGIDGVYLECTAAAVRAFRAKAGLPEADFVDRDCWAALVDETFSLGDRTLYLRFPYFHGSDVRLLQQALNVLGFICGEVDGIFGANTEKALREFQANTGIDPDGIAGSLTFNAVMRLHHVWEGKDSQPHSAARTGFARAAQVLEEAEVCFFGVSDPCCLIASRISNLAFATTASSRVTSADSLETMPSKTILLIELSIGDESSVLGLPHVQFSDDPSFVSRLQTALSAVQGEPPRLLISIPESYFADVNHPTVREQQHIAVTVLDAFCSAWT